MSPTFKLKEALTGDSGTILLTTPPPDIFNSRQILRKERNDAPLDYQNRS